MQSTLYPDSAKATARFNVVVVFATPPFWLAKAITSACLTGVSGSTRSTTTSWREGASRSRGKNRSGPSSTTSAASATAAGAGAGADGPSEASTSAAGGEPLLTVTSGATSFRSSTGGVEEGTSPAACEDDGSSSATGPVAERSEPLSSQRNSSSEFSASQRSSPRSATASSICCSSSTIGCGSSTATVADFFLRLRNPIARVFA